MEDKVRMAEQSERIAMRSQSPPKDAGQDRSGVLEDENEVLMTRNRAQQGELERCRRELVETTQHRSSCFAMLITTYSSRHSRGASGCQTGIGVVE
jgi:hypothetical protein